MSRASCSRMWQAEAVADGSLSDADSTSFERHAVTCADCAAEVEALSGLLRTVANVDGWEPDALTMRRLRRTLLELAHRRRTKGEARPRLGRVALLALAAVLVLGLAALKLHPLTGTDGVAGVAGFRVLDIDHAIIVPTSDRDGARVLLADGVAGFEVEHVRPGHRFVLLLPDGEIEVRGTRFTVSVHGGRTRSVDVSEGVVVLRLRGLEAEQRLGAGGHWAVPVTPEGMPPEPPAALPAAAPLLVQPPVAAAPLPASLSAVPVPLGATTARPVAAPPLGSHANVSRARRAAAPPQGVSRAADVDAGRPQTVASERFAAAIAAFRDGAYGVADARLESFGESFRTDSRAEDAAFLRVMCHKRQGDDLGAAALARAYLREFPDGFRRREAERLAAGR